MLDSTSVTVKRTSKLDEMDYNRIRAFIGSDEWSE
jgi:hypothetical protein